MNLDIIIYTDNITKNLSAPLMVCLNSLLFGIIMLYFIHKDKPFMVYLFYVLCVIAGIYGLVIDTV